jgi:hypothetical protein
MTRKYQYETAGGCPIRRGAALTQLICLGKRFHALKYRGVSGLCQGKNGLGGGQAHLEIVYPSGRMTPVPSRVKAPLPTIGGSRKLLIALLGRTGSSSLDVRGVVRAEKIEHAHHPAERGQYRPSWRGTRVFPHSRSRVASGRSAYVLRKGAIRSRLNWDFPMRLPWAWACRECFRGAAP